MDIIQQQIKTFWGKGWKKRKNEDINTQTKEKCLEELGERRLILKLWEAEQVREMKNTGLKEKSVLEIGCGMGNSSILFALEGARVTASDITDEAVLIAKSKFELLGLAGQAIQANAEQLPFADNTFDVVFSSGVLHHTPDTQKAVDEIYRVLKPGGEAVVMLYAKWSFFYLISLLLVRGILLGGLFRYRAQWLGNVTETEWCTENKKLNLVTKVYSARQMRNLFHNFKVIGMRKHSFTWADIFPGIYRIIKRRRVPIGNIRMIIPSALENWIGRWAGFCLVIHVKKT